MRHTFGICENYGAAGSATTLKFERLNSRIWILGKSTKVAVKRVTLPITSAAQPDSAGLRAPN